jgi:hypothetical protein
VAPSGAAGLQPAWRTTARPKAFSGSPRTDTGGIRTHITQGLSLLAIPVRAPCPRIHPSSFRRAPGGNRTHASAIPRRQAPVTTRGRFAEHRHPRVKDPRAPGGGRTRAADLARRHAAIHTTGAVAQSIRRGSNPRRRRGRAACFRYTTDALQPVGPGGLEPPPAGLRVPDAAASTLIPCSINPQTPTGRGMHSPGRRAGRVPTEGSSGITRQP